MAEKKVKIEYVDLAKMNTFAGNPRKIAPDEMKKLRRSLKEFGFVDPVIARRKDNLVIGGHQRIEAAKAEGLTTAPVVYLDDITDEKAYLLNIALNKISGEWDLPKLGDLFQELDTGAVDLTLSGFDLSEIEGVVNGLDSTQKQTQEVNVNQGKYDVIVSCASEDQQQKTYDFLLSNGYSCRVLTY